MTVFELLINKELNGVCDYSTQTLEYISNRVAIWDSKTEKRAYNLRASVKDFYVEENNRIVIYI